MVFAVLILVNPVRYNLGLVDLFIESKRFLFLILREMDQLPAAPAQGQDLRGRVLVAMPIIFRMDPNGFIESIWLEQPEVSAEMVLDEDDNEDDVSSSDGDSMSLIDDNEDDPMSSGDEEDGSDADYDVDNDLMWSSDDDTDESTDEGADENEDDDDEVVFLEEIIVLE